MEILGIRLVKNPAKAVRTSVVVVSVIYAAVLFVLDIELDGAVRKALAYLPSAAGLAMVVFDKWLWRWPPISWLKLRPRIDGLWATSIRPDAESHIPEGGNWGPIEGYTIIEQSFWSVSVHQYTEESESHSRAITLLAREDSGQRTLNLTYDNVPRREHLPRSPRNVGACELKLARGDPSTIKGNYFTDRFTAGELSLVLVDRTVDYADFESAQKRAAAHGG